eukprot:TRINITY_DN69840_c0_g1_i2.p1 TRINITY_DN69840_c0_g1~~TRINITY_DN69840_c0_g1_i2.p1  ORF type:complete len:270 (+),score=58.13 TRINITY_DN69840_c0_g1_i2:243-1052(+)
MVALDERSFRPSSPQRGEAVSSSALESFLITIGDFSGDTLCVLNAYPGWSGRDVRDAVAEFTGLRAKRLTLILDGQRLTDSMAIPVREGLHLMLVRRELSEERQAEFEKAFKVLRIPGGEGISRKRMATLLRFLGIGASWQSINASLKHLAASSAQLSLDDVADIVCMKDEELRVEWQNLLQVFQASDPQGTGYISRKSLSEILQLLGESDASNLLMASPLKDDDRVSYEVVANKVFDVRKERALRTTIVMVDDLFNATVLHPQSIIAL